MYSEEILVHLTAFCHCYCNRNRVSLEQKKTKNTDFYRFHTFHDHFLDLINLQGGSKSGHPRNSMDVCFFGPPCRSSVFVLFSHFGFLFSIRVFDQADFISYPTER